MSEHDYTDRPPDCSFCHSLYHVEPVKVDGDEADLCPECIGALSRCPRCGDFVQLEGLCAMCEAYERDIESGEVDDQRAERDAEEAR